MDKNFIPFLYERTTIPSMLKHYCEPLLTDSNVLTRMKAKQLLEYRAILLDSEFKMNLSSGFEDLFNKILREYPPNILFFELLGRIKALFSSINKLEELEQKTMDTLKCKFVSSIFKTELNTLSTKKQEEFIQQKFLEIDSNEQMLYEFQRKLENRKFVGENPFQRVHDFFAFRIVLEDMEANELIVQLYGIANLVIEHFVALGYEVIEHDPLLETGKLKVSDSNIYIPKESLIKPQYRKLIKDYVRYPKTSGYQGIHIVVKDPFTGRYFEIQIRSRSMDLIAETLASHSNYKLKKYGVQQKEEEEIDYSRIHVRGFRYMEYFDATGEKNRYLSDTAGIKQPLTIIRKKSGY